MAIGLWNGSILDDGMIWLLLFAVMGVAIVVLMWYMEYVETKEFDKARRKNTGDWSLSDRDLEAYMEDRKDRRNTR